MVAMRWLGLRKFSGGMRLTGAERRRLETVERSTSLLVALAAFMKPRVSLIDGFDAMEGDGPRHGRHHSLGTVIAGTDPVAVDAVAASIMGFDPREIAYLRQAEIHGLGTADLSAITVVGDTVAAPRRFRRHSADPLLRLVSCSAPRAAAMPKPHFASSPGAQAAPERGNGVETSQEGWKAPERRPRMRIGFDGSCLSNRRGFGRFSRLLLAASRGARPSASSSLSSTGLRCPR